MSVAGSDELAQRVTLTVGRSSVHVAGKAATMTIRELRQIISGARELIANARAERIETGKMSARMLQWKADGDVHHQTVSGPRMVKAMEAELNKHGVDFAVEKNPDGTCTVSFQGKDLPTLELAMERAAEKLETPTKVQSLREAIEKRAESLASRRGRRKRPRAHRRKTKKAGPEL